MNNNPGISDVLKYGSPIGTRHLTIRYVLTFVLLAGLQVGTYFIFRAQIEISRSLGAVYAETANQRLAVAGNHNAVGKARE